MRALRMFETSASSLKSTCCRIIPEDLNLQQNLCEDLRSHNCMDDYFACSFECLSHIIAAWILGVQREGLGTHFDARQSK